MGGGRPIVHVTATSAYGKPAVSQERVAEGSPKLTAGVSQLYDMLLVLPFSGFGFRGSEGVFSRQMPG